MIRGHANWDMAKGEPVTLKGRCYCGRATEWTVKAGDPPVDFACDCGLSVSAQAYETGGWAVWENERSEPMRPTKTSGWSDMRVVPGEFAKRYSGEPVSAKEWMESFKGVASRRLLAGDQFDMRTCGHCLMQTYARSGEPLYCMNSACTCPHEFERLGFASGRCAKCWRSMAEFEQFTPAKPVHYLPLQQVKDAYCGSLRNEEARTYYPDRVTCERCKLSWSEHAQKPWELAAECRSAEQSAKANGESLERQVKGLVAYKHARQEWGAYEPKVTGSRTWSMEFKVPLKGDFGAVPVVRGAFDDVKPQAEQRKPIPCPNGCGAELRVTHFDPATDTQTHEECVGCKQESEQARWHGWSDGDLRAELKRREDAWAEAGDRAEQAEQAMCAAGKLCGEVRSELERRGRK